MAMKKPTTLFRPALASLLLFTASVHAAVIGPDQAGYLGTNAAAPAFVDLAVVGGATSVLGGVDDAAVLVNLPFPFSFYGNAVTQACISSNGVIWFPADPAACGAFVDFVPTDLSAGQTAPDLAGIFPFWSDLTFQVAGAGSVLYGTVGTAPNRQFIVQWNHAYPQGSANSVTFEAILRETTGAVSFQYAQVTLGAGDAADNGGRAAVGLRGVSGATNGRQLQWSYRASVLANQTALQFNVPAPQTITFNTLPTVTLPASPFALTATATSGLSVTFASTTLSICTVSGSTVTPLAAGTCSITASQPGDSNYAVATPVSRSFTINPAPSGGGGGAGGGGAGGGGAGGGGGGSALTASLDTATITAPLNAGLAKQTVTLTFQTYTQGAPTFASNTSTNQGLGWLSLTPSTGTMTQSSYAGFLYTYQTTVTINVDPTGFPAGSSYTGSANFSAAGGVASVNVTMNVVAQPSVFTLAPQTVQFTYRKGDTKLPPSQSLAVASKPTGTVWSAAVTTATGGNWLTASPATSTAPSTMSASLNANIVQALAVGNYSGKVIITGNGATTVEIPVSLSVIRADAPTIPQGGVVPVYSTSNTIQAGSWISIYGTNLAASTEVWKGDFPTTLGGVSVTVNGKPGYLWFVSPSQINLQAPDDTATGTVTVTITNTTGTTTSTATLAPASPSFSLLDAKHVAAIILETSGYSIVGPTGAFAYYTRPVLPGENLVLYGVGFGPTNPSVKAGELFASAAPTVNPVTVTIGGVQAPVAFAGLVGAGLYQLNVTVPEVGPGDQPIQATVNGVQVPVGPVVTIGSR